MNKETKDILLEAGFDPSSVEELEKADNLLARDPAWHKALSLSPSDESLTADDLRADHDALAASCGVPVHTVDLLHLTAYLPALRAAYRAHGLDDALFVGAARDLKFKNSECLTMEGVCGTRSFAWHIAFYRIKRFALGRLQYEDRVFPGPDFDGCGITLKTGGMTLGMHIPSGSPLTREACLDSLKKAFAFFGCTKDRPLVVHCRSWLLNPDHRSMLPKESNIVRFMDMFAPLGYTEYDTFGDAWRVFGPVSLEKPVAEWPTDTALRRGYVKWLLAGNKDKYGEGLLVFDGETLLTERK